MRDESPPILTKDRNMLTFYEEARPNGLHPGLFNKVLMVRVSVPGDPSSSEKMVEEEYPETAPHPVHGKVRKNELVYAKFRDYIEAYKANNAALLTAGTPLEAWPQVNKVQIAMLRYHGIHSVDALSGLSDEHISRIGPGGRELVNKAKAYLKATVEGFDTAKADAEKQALEARLSAMELQWTELNMALAELPEDAKAALKATLKKNHGDASKRRTAA